MDITIFQSKPEMGIAAASLGAESIRKQLAASGSAAIILATGASQFEMISALVKQPDIDWSKVTCFHLDEYVGLSIDHPASFRKYLKQRFVDQLPVAPLNFHFIDGETDATSECNRLSQLISQVEIDVAFLLNQKRNCGFIVFSLRVLPVTIFHTVSDRVGVGVVAR